LRSSWSLERVKKDATGNNLPVKKAMIDYSQIEIFAIYKVFDK
jgi:hypothetical protein